MSTNLCKRCDFERFFLCGFVHRLAKKGGRVSAPNYLMRSNAEAQSRIFKYSAVSSMVHFYVLFASLENALFTY